MKLLTPPQRSMLTQIFLRAWKRRRDAKATDLTFNQYRHAESIACCGHKISEAPRSAFDDLYTHAMAENGEKAKAYDHAVKSLKEPNDWRGWQRQILEQLARASLPWEYSQPIAKKKFGTLMENLSPDQMKAVFIDTRRAVKAKLKRASATTQAAIADEP